MNSFSVYGGSPVGRKNFIAQNKWLLIILSVSFGLSIFYSFYYKIEPAVDALSYDKIAQNIVSGAGYREGIGTDLAYDYSIARVGPLYEYFLAGIYKVFGHSYPAVWIMQALLHSASAYLVYLICFLAFAGSDNKKKIGLWAAAIFGLYPDLIEISAMLMTETLYLFFTCLMVYLFMFYVKNNSLKTFLLLSFISGLAVLVRPPLLFFLPILFFYLYKKREWGRAVIMAVILILVFLPWTARNYRIYGEIMPFGTAGAINFWIGNHVGANGEQEAGAEISDYISQNSAVDINSESMNQFKSFVVNYPGEFAKLTALRINKYFSVLRPMGFWFYASGWRQILFVFSSAIFSFLALVLGLGGIIKLLKLKNEYINYLIAFAVATPLILFITVVETRYRFQIYPLLAVFAAYFIASFGQDRRIWFRTAFVSLAIILANGILDGLLNFNQFKDKIFSHFG
ncbi:MAG: glycosyltransferase family 39 protein [bacterium]|nr:glycosyltransferase family 39 protein [bacterium]